MSSYRDVAERITARLSELGVAVKPGSRFSQMMAAMRGSGTVNRDDSKFPAAREGVRDLLILDYVLQNQSEQISDKEYMRHLSRIVRDPVDPVSPNKETPGRNYQHEMYVAAVCSAAGLSPVFAEPPDVMGTHIGQAIGFAAKRMKNARRFKEHCKKASDQIRRAGAPGWIVCDVTHTSEQGNQMIPLEVSDDMKDVEWERDQRAFIEQHYSQFPNWFRDSDVRAIVLVKHFLKTLAIDHAGLSSYTCFVNLHPSHELKTLEFESLKGLWLEALPN